MVQSSSALIFPYAVKPGIEFDEPFQAFVGAVGQHVGPRNLDDLLSGKEFDLNTVGKCLVEGGGAIMLHTAGGELVWRWAL